jgi:dihydropteroate synthase
MLTLQDLAALAAADPAALAARVGPLRIGQRAYDVDAAPIVMGCVNLSRDSTYRESIATSTSSAIRKGLVMHAQGAAIIDIGAESSTARAARVDPQAQIAALVPVIERLVDEDVTVSAETYAPAVVSACLKAGASVLNLTGLSEQEEILTLAAEHEATVVLCYVGGENVRQITDVTLDADPIPGLLDHFAARIELARSLGVERLVIDPGMGFYYANLTDPSTRARHQANVLLSSFRLKTLGLPVCNAMPHAFDLFEDQFRTAEGFFSVLGMLGGTSVFRTHEVAHVRSVLDALLSLDQDPTSRR